jgi:hypothetical protein
MSQILRMFLDTLQNNKVKIFWLSSFSMYLPWLPRGGLSLAKLVLKIFEHLKKA